VLQNDVAAWVTNDASEVPQVIPELLAVLNGPEVEIGVVVEGECMHAVDVRAEPRDLSLRDAPRIGHPQWSTHSVHSAGLIDQLASRWQWHAVILGKDADGCAP